jgi:hypothetical protein
MTDNVVKAHFDPHSRPCDVIVADYSGGRSGPKCQLWRETGEIRVIGGHLDFPVALDIADYSSGDKRVLVQMTADDARWLIARLLKVTEHAEERERMKGLRPWPGNN